MFMLYHVDFYCCLLQLRWHIMAEYVNYVDLSDLQTDGMGAVVSQHIYRISKNISYLY